MRRERLREQSQLFDVIGGPGAGCFFVILMGCRLVGR
jgi:hypothetical protein